MNLNNSIFAEQSPFAELIIEQKKPETSKFQESTKRLYSYYDGTPLTVVPVDNYTITNLPDTIAQIPKNSIFDQIKSINPDDPDFRFVKISTIRESVDLKPSVMPQFTNLTVAKQTNDNSSNKIPLQRRNIFVDDLRILNVADDPELSFNTLGETLEDPRFENLTLPLEIASLNSELLPQIVKCISSTNTDISNENQTEPVTENVKDIIKYISRKAGVDDATLSAVLSGKNTSKNEKTITVHVIKQFIQNQYKDDEIPRLSDLTKDTIADVIKTFVTTYKLNEEETSSS